MRCWPPCVWLIATLWLATVCCWHSLQELTSTWEPGRKALSQCPFSTLCWRSLALFLLAKEMFRESGSITTEQAIKDVFGTKRPQIDNEHNYYLPLPFFTSFFYSAYEHVQVLPIKHTLMQTHTPPLGPTFPISYDNTFLISS